jgi:hypothetical protein
LFGDKNSPAQQYIGHKEWITKAFEYDVIIVLSTRLWESGTFCKCKPSRVLLGFCTSWCRNWQWIAWWMTDVTDWSPAQGLTILFGIQSLIFPWYIVEWLLTFPTLFVIKY